MSAKYIQLANQLKNFIQKNLESDAICQLPTESALCQTYSVSRQTVRKALSVLEEEHLIQKNRAAGRMLSEHHSTMTPARLPF